ncbi:MAG: winged helix-turn-helix domain-containing protein [Alphaproteobacteria bacterium]
MTFRDLRVDLARLIAWRGTRRLKLNPTAFRMLVYFMGRPGRVHTRDLLLDILWPNKPETGARTVDVNIRHLRRALNSCGEPDLVRTVHGFGYALDDNPGAGRGEAPY